MWDWLWRAQPLLNAFSLLDEFHLMITLTLIQTTLLMWGRDLFQFLSSRWLHFPCYVNSECTNAQEMCNCVAEAHKIIIALEYLDDFTRDMLEEEGLWCVRVVPSYIVSILIKFGGLFWEREPPHMALNLLLLICKYYAVIWLHPLWVVGIKLNIFSSCAISKTILQYFSEKSQHLILTV